MKSFLIMLVACVMVSCSRNNDSKEIIGDTDRVKASSSYNAQSLKEALLFIEKTHKQAKTGLVLNPGATDTDIEKIESIIGCKLPEELKVLWRWKNGEKTDYFIWYHRFLSIEESVKQYQQLRSGILMDWKKNWIPVFEFQEEWYGVECHSTPGKASPVVFYFVENGSQLSYTNLTTFMKTMSVAMQKGLIKWENEFWKENIAELAQLHGFYNPGIRFPYYVKKQ